MDDGARRIFQQGLISQRELILTNQLPTVLANLSKPNSKEWKDMQNTLLRELWVISGVLDQ